MTRTLRTVGLLASATLLAGCASVGGTATKQQSIVATGSTAVTTTSPSAAAPSSTAAAPAPKAGDTVRVTDGDNVYDITITPLAEATPGQFATVSGTLYATTVTVKVTAGTFDSNPLYFSAKSPDGDTYDAALGSTDDQLTTESTPAGQSVRGTVAFDVPKGAAIALVIYSAVLGPQLATWTTS